MEYILVRGHFRITGYNWYISYSKDELVYIIFTIILTKLNNNLQISFDKCYHFLN